ncbi:MAG: hypothetical protein FWE06_02585 [Oscillospiraceae bacterium]|nr:hypothetical protein [Oscillospiraceae bacterium]
MENKGHINDAPYMQRLSDFISQEYNLIAKSITPAARGYYGETWRLDTTDKSYFAKVDYFMRHQIIFQNSLSVIEYLCDNGIGFIPKIIKTKSNMLYSEFDSATVGLFEWIDGTNIETDETKVAEYQMLCEIYPLTKQGFGIPTMTFSNSVVVQVYEKWESLKDTHQNNVILSTLEKYRENLSHCASRLAHFSSVCRMNTDHFYFTHGDAGGNFFVGNDRNYFVDWDEVIYAPIERDAWVMCCHDWARALFNDTLNKNNIPYQLRMERLAYYCYYMLFWYLGEFLADIEKPDIAKIIDEYLDETCWIWDRVRFADKV